MPFRWDIVHFKVEEDIFSPARQAFLKHSSVFEDMYQVGDGSNGEGRSEDHPIVLEGYKSADFEALLMILYPDATDLISGKFTLTKEQWIGVLRLSRPWQMHEIRDFAIGRLSSEPFSLTPVEKVSLARDHKVSKWLVEGLTSLASGNLELSPDELEEAIGLRAAFRVVGIRNKSLSQPVVTSLLVNGTQATALALSTLHCGYCVKPFLPTGSACQSCQKGAELMTPGSVYLPSTTTISTLNRDDIGHSFYFRGQFLLCCACHGRFITVGFNCSGCSRTNSASVDLIVPLSATPIPTRPTEGLVRDVFKDEITEYDM